MKLPLLVFVFASFQLGNGYIAKVPATTQVTACSRRTNILRHSDWALIGDDRHQKPSLDDDTALKALMYNDFDESNSARARVDSFLQNVLGGVAVVGGSYALFFVLQYAFFNLFPLLFALGTIGAAKLTADYMAAGGNPLDPVPYRYSKTSRIPSSDRKWKQISQKESNVASETAVESTSSQAVENTRFYALLKSARQRISEQQATSTDLISQMEDVKKRAGDLNQRVEKDVVVYEETLKALKEGV